MSSQRATIMSVDGDQALQGAMKAHLEREGYRFFAARDAAEMWLRLDSLRPDMIVVDLALSGGDGFSLLPAVRGQAKAAVIATGASADIADKVICLEMGADDYLAKPIELRELTARIRSVLRRTLRPAAAANDGGGRQNIAAVARLRFDRWILDRQQYQVFDGGGRPAGLTSGEFRLLEALVSAPNRVMSRERLFEITRSGRYDLYDRSIDIQIGRIRRKLCDDSQPPAVIRTVRGAGYIFCGTPCPLE